MRLGNKAAKSAADHISVLARALAQLLDDLYRPDGLLIGEKILVRTYSAGASRQFLHHLDSLGLQFSTSYALPVASERLIGRINEKNIGNRQSPSMAASVRMRESLT